MFGNIGAKDRLDFTVIGPAVNEASRIEALCKPLGRRLLLSGQMQKALETPLPSVGVHRLKGVGEPVEVFSGED